MDRAEATGLGIAVAGHGLLLAILSAGLATASKQPLLQNQPMEVSFVEEVALQSSAPTPSAEAPPPSASEPEAPASAEAPPLPVQEPVTLPEPPAPTPPRVQQPTPQPRPVAAKPQPAPRPVAAKPQPAPKPAPPKAQPAPAAKPSARPAPQAARRPGLNLDLSSLSDGPATSKSTSPPAAVAGPAVQASLASEVRRQLKPHWKAPTGADVELLRTEVTVALGRNGAIERIGEIRTSGQTGSNKLQVKLHQEQAVRAVRLAAPFKLPAQFYDAWKVITPTFDRRLSQ